MPNVERSSRDTAPAVLRIRRRSAPSKGNVDVIQAQSAMRGVTPQEADVTRKLNRAT